MSVGIALLVHEELHRAAELVQALQAAGCKIAVHVDAKVPSDECNSFKQTLEGLENVVYVPRFHCEWGQFSLVKAQLATAETLLNHFSDLSHVVQLSGSCLPNRPISELQDFLNQHEDTDFIESVTVGGVNWTKGGLEAERFNLYFPFSFTERKRWFDFFVKLQRRFGIKRKLPKGLVPHIGSQWWVLSCATMKAIIEDPDRAQYDRYFKHNWIPDESYFQSLARKHSSRLRSLSLTYSRFDYRGKPMVFYDDHSRYIEHLDSFFIRKVWPGANQLYKNLLNPARVPETRNPDMAVAFNANIKRAESRWLEGRQGLMMQSRAPLLPLVNSATSYTVLSGFDRVFRNLPSWLQQKTGIVLFEHLFSKENSDYEKSAKLLKNNLGSTPQNRDYNPVEFLLNFVWNHSDDDPVFYFDPLQNPQLARFMVKDPNARIFHIRSAWLLDLFRENQRDIKKIQPRVHACALREQAQLKALAKGKAKVQIIPLEEFYAQPGAVTEDLLTALRPALAIHNRDVPDLRPHEGLKEYIEFLKDAGLNLKVEIDHRNNLAGLSV